MYLVEFEPVIMAHPRSDRCTFYIARDAAYEVVIYDTTTLGEVLSTLIGPPGDGFSWGAFLTDPVPDDTIRDGIPENTRIESSYFYGRLSNNPRINMRTLLCSLFNVTRSM